jgi:RimJ/RimL family protein N-acetyltransferase
MWKSGGPRTIKWTMNGVENLETERLILRPWEPKDADFVLDLYSRWEVQRFIGNPPRVMADRAEAEERIRVPAGTTTRCVSSSNW